MEKSEKNMYVVYFIILFLKLEVFLLYSSITTNFLRKIDTFIPATTLHQRNYYAAVLLYSVFYEQQPHSKKIPIQNNTADEK